MPFIPDPQPAKKSSFVPDADQQQPDPPHMGLLDRLKQGQSYIDAASNGLVKGATFGNVDIAEKGWMGKDWSQAAKDHPYVDKAAQVVGGVGTGMLTGAGIAALAPEAAGAGAALARVGLNTAGGLAQGVAQKPAEGETRLGALDPTTMRGALNYIPGAASAVGEAAAPILKSGANAMKLRAMGINKNWPIKEGAEIDPLTGDVTHADVTGLGNKMNDLKIGGSRIEMKAQVGQKLQEQEKNLMQMLKDKDKVTPNDTLSDSYKQLMDRYRDPVTGTITNPDKYHTLSDQVENLSKNTAGYSNEGLLQLKRAENGSYAQTGQLNKGLDPMINKVNADWARQQLNKADPRVADTLQTEKALLLAQKALNKPAPISKSGLSVRMLAGMAAGGGAAGPLGGLVGAGAGAASEIPAVQSALARALQGTSNAAVSPELYQALAGLKDSE